MDQLNCNIVVMKGSHPKVLRLNLASTNDLETPFYSAASSPITDCGRLQTKNMKHTTPVSSPEDPSTSSYTRTSGENSLSSPDTVASFFVVYEQNPLFEGLHKGRNVFSGRNTYDHLRGRAIEVSTLPDSTTCRNRKLFCIAQNNSVDEKQPASGKSHKITKIPFTSISTKSDHFIPSKAGIRRLVFQQDGSDGYVFNSSIREAVSLSKTSSTPPPLCSLCQFKAPSFGKPPHHFHYSELEEATAGFADANFVAEGRFGWVHRGVLRNGLIIAVKQLKFVGSETDDFCREVRVLSCAQHRNVVLLIGFCIEGKKRLLVYEYICNGSLDFHLHGNEMPTLDWHARLKIAIGTARGLRYLHEDCRVGCISHQNLRPNNILLTHDFEPLVADFGLARVQSEWRYYDRNQAIGTSGYLAPEYFNDGEVTEKVDIYAFGLVLLELITGQRAQDLQYCMEHQFLQDNIHALAATEPIHILAYKHQLLDPRLAGSQLQGLPYELHAMGYAASLCLQQDPDLRPPMSKVVKMLEGGNPVAPLGSDLDSIGCRSGHMQGLKSSTLAELRRRHSRRLSY